MTPLDPVPPAVEPDKPSSWKPTRKWWAAFAGSVAAILASLIESGNFDNTERGMCATALVALVSAYFIENEQTVRRDGVPS